MTKGLRNLIVGIVIAAGAAVVFVTGAAIRSCAADHQAYMATLKARSKAFLANHDLREPIDLYPDWGRSLYVWQCRKCDAKAIGSVLLVADYSGPVECEVSE